MKTNHQSFNPVEFTADQRDAFKKWTAALADFQRSFKEANPNLYLSSMWLVVYAGAKTDYSGLPPYEDHFTVNFRIELAGRKGEGHSLPLALSKCYAESELQEAQRRRKSHLDEAKRLGRDIREMEARKR